MANLNALASAIVGGNASLAKTLTAQALAEGVPPARILNDGLVAGMNVIGAKFKCNEFYVPEVLIAARAMMSAMDILRPVLVNTGIKPAGRIVIGTVKGDLHDIGKNLVVMMLEGAGFETIDLGVDVRPEKFVEEIRSKKAQVVALSAILTTTMPAMAETVAALQTAGVRKRVAVIVGGAPVTQSYADAIGADGYAPDAVTAADKVKDLMRNASWKPLP
jgi:5-methyltetrahydrofolate--homocysteine methyltransferase